jgi:hypothetical protein
MDPVPGNKVTPNASLTVAINFDTNFHPDTVDAVSTGNEFQTAAGKPVAGQGPPIRRWAALKVKIEAYDFGEQRDDALRCARPLR